MQVIEPTDIIQTSFVPVLIFGPPGSWKTTLAQTASMPLTLDFDKGIHRVQNRGRAIRFDTWKENVDAGGPRGEYRDGKGNIIPYNTLVVDTGGRALDTMIPDILKENSKNGYNGSLSMQGWGVLGNRFTTWMKLVASWGKDVVMVCHQESGKDDAGNPDIFPDLPGKMSLKEIHKQFDIIGRIRYEGPKRVLDFNPCEGSTMCKNAANWMPRELPNLHNEKTFLADLIADAKLKIGQLSEASATVAKAVAAWQAKLDPNTVNLEKLNTEVLEEFKSIAKGEAALRSQVWALITDFATVNGCEFNAKSKVFTQKASAA